MEKIKLIFIGTGAIGTALLKRLSEDDRFEVLMALTGQDKPAGRKMELQPSPVKRTAEEKNIPVFQPENINSPESLEHLKKAGADMMLLMAYGQLLSQAVLDITPQGCLNVHASLLPKYRGASPIQSTFLNGETETGICLMKMVSRMDAGPVYERFPIAIEKNDNAETLSERLARLTAEKIPDALAGLAAGRLSAQEQNESAATYVTKISKADGEIDWKEDAERISAKIRAFYGWPGTYTFFRGKRLKIIRAQPLEGVSGGYPGTVTKDGIACKNGLIKPLELQPEGKNPQSLAGFLNGNPDFVGSVLG
jgi:methionyl-tRNA formyltransferase